jgi:hypothetical protein
MILRNTAITIILLSLIIAIFQVKRMNMSGNVSQDGKEDINAEVESAAGDQEHSKRRQEDLDQ